MRSTRQGVGAIGAARVVHAVALALLVALGAAPAVEAEDLRLRLIDPTGGSVSEVVTTIYQDRAGFVWIGSRDGLTRYDGYSFTVFEHDTTDPTSISDNTIRVIYEDADGGLWVGTNTGGLNRLDRATWTFEHFRHDSADPTTLSHDSVYAIAEDAAGALWIGTQVGLNRFDPDTRSFERFHHVPGDPTTLGSDYVYWLHLDGGGRLWVSTIGGGLHLWDPERESFQGFRHDPDDPSSLSTDSPLVIAEDPAGALWISSMQGVNLMERETGTFRRYGLGPTPDSRLGDVLATTIAIERPGLVWVGTHGGGLNRIDAATGIVRRWRNDASNPYGLGSDIVSALLHDASDGLWIGTWGGGVRRLTNVSLTLSEASVEARLPAGLSSRDVTAVAHDRSGRLWIGTRSGDVVRRDGAAGDGTIVLQGGDDGIARIIHQIVEDPTGRIWVGTNGGVVEIGPAGDVRDIVHDPHDPGSLGPGYVRAMHVDSGGRLWVGTGEGGLQRLDDAGRVVERFRNDPADDASLSDDYITVIHEDGQGYLWLGTRSGGLNRLDPASGTLVRYPVDSTNERALSHHFVTSIVEDPGGELWIGTGGGGVNRLAADGIFHRYTQSQGLLDDDVMAIVPDDHGALWLSTKRGLAQLDPRTGWFSRLGVADGLPSGEFEPGAVTRGGGMLYFGSVKGLVAVPADLRFPEPTPSPTVITSIRTAQGDIETETPIWELDAVSVPWGEWLSMRFAVLDYSADQSHRYAYRLGDDESEWVDLGPRREITFTDLGSGRHVLSVRGRNRRGVWSDAAQDLAIVVVPPFWMTNWFRAAVLLAVVGAVVTAHRVRVAAVQRRNEELERLYNQREKARSELARAYERLRRLTRRVEAAKEDERRHIARELHDELGPALTAVIINLHLVAAAPTSSAPRVADTIALVDRLVDRVRELSLDLRPPLLDELGLVPALRGYIETEAGRAGIAIEVVEDGRLAGLPSDVEITAFRLVQEAVTNVIRHARASEATVRVSCTDGTLDLSVTDDGVGFDVARTLAGPAGDALGLLGMQERMQNLGGELRIESVPGRGTEVRARMRLRRAS